MKRFVSSGLLRVSSIFVSLLVAAVFFTGSAHAANISVNSNADTVADDGVCTLREAITATNNDVASGATPGECSAGAGTDTISFAITGLADYTVSGQSGYTIAPLSQLPVITQTVVIDGYTQPGAQENTAIAPNPLNGILLIEIDGVSAGSTNGLTFGANNLTVKGLVINNFNSFTADGIGIAGNDNKIQGCYIGTEPDGMTAAPNELGISSEVSPGNGLLVGGTNPEDRNIISGNTEGGSSPNTDHINWTYQGNYIGVGRDGVTAVPNAQPGGSGAISIDNDNGHTVGGSAPGAINVISGNRSMGIAPHNTDNLLVEGNYFGVGYDGATPVPNESTGINISDSANSVIRNNIISYNENQGINFNDNSVGLLVEGNTIEANDGVGINVSNNSDDIDIRNNVISSNLGGVSLTDAVGGVLHNNQIILNQTGVGFQAGTTDVDITSNTIASNSQNGVAIVGATNVDIGLPGSGNQIHNNTYQNVYIFGAVGFGVTTQNVRVRANSIGRSTDSNAGIGIYVSGDATDVIVGGVDSADRNVITTAEGVGVAVSSLGISGLGSIFPSNIAILGNHIRDTSSDLPYLGFSSGLGVDLFDGIDTDLVPDGQPNTFTNLGPTPNDASDPDTGPNNFMNFPVVNDATQNGTNLAINFDLDAADSPVDQYRVEFFANDTADDSGYGEGQTYLGSTTVTNGAGQLASLTLPANTDLTGKVLSATTTAINAATPSDFGATSEFSQVRSITVLPQAALADTGDNALVYLLGLGVLIVMGVGLRKAAYARI